MSKTDNNPVLNGVSGMLGKTLVIRQVNGRTIISNRPKKRDKPTDHQLKTKEKFMRAVAYAKQQIADPERKSLYKAGVNRTIPNAYTAALKDFLNAPVVREINVTTYKGEVGNVIHIVATDDFEIVSLIVDIYDGAGALLESGEAVRADLTLVGWNYVATLVNEKIAGSRIVVTAKDRPGNITLKEAVKA